jgi:NhaP-type Na+/H+ or K+/H+ antiporter
MRLKDLPVGPQWRAMEHDLYAAIAVFSGCVIVWGLLSARLERWDVSAPLAFVLMGLVVAHGPVALIHLSLRSATIRTLAEITLALVLFADASRVNARTLRPDAALPGRLLGIGLPLTIGAGFAAAAGIFPGVELWVAAAIAAIVAPTDAALGASIMQDEHVPEGIRRILNVESGLNDGIATPFVNLFLAGAVSAEAIHSSGLGRAVINLLGGAGLGAAIGIAGALLLIVAARNGWSAASYRPLLIGALALFAYTAALLAGTNGFVAAFVAGMAFGTVIANRGEPLDFAEEAGTLLSLVVWFIFGAVMLVPGFQAAGWRDVLFAVLALTVLRMAPVAVALLGSGLDRPTVAFVGWFGPRGLASVVFGLIAVDSLVSGQARVVLATVTVTVAMSVLLHGVSAAPLARRYGRLEARLPGADSAEDTKPALSTRKITGHLPVLGRRSRSDPSA